jgi:hypothetical protein
MRVLTNAGAAALVGGVAGLDAADTAVRVARIVANVSPRLTASPW